MACITPLSIKNPTATGTAFLAVPCGKCPKCLETRTKHWIFRLQQEEKMHEKSLFVTLTYDVDELTKTPNGLLTLNKEDWQKFMKRLRKNTATTYYNEENKKKKKFRKFKYYMCGEYGSKTQRPHYHAILFGATESEIIQAWCIGGKSKGIVHVGQVTTDSIAYTTKYINKGKLIPMFAGDDRLKEFSLMSKGMGLNYIDDKIIRYHNQNDATYLIEHGGYRLSMPRYYKQRIFPEEKLRVLNNQLIAKYETIINDKISQAGSWYDYEYARREALNAYLYNFKQQQKSSRQKI